MDTTTKFLPSKRNKTLHRFYEPLVLLHVLNKVQGERMPRQRDDMSSPADASRCELRRRFLDSLAYICDHEKGGDSMTAVFVSSPPLTYHLACNSKISHSSKVIPFLRCVLSQLRDVVKPTVDTERSLLGRCVQFSKKRIETYRRCLQSTLKRCLQSSTDADTRNQLQSIDETLAESNGSHADLCRACFAMIKSQDLGLIVEAAKRSEDYGNGRNPFADLRHFVGRLGTHVQVVHVLLVAAKRFPTLFIDFEINISNGPPSLTLPPPPRRQLTLSGIAKRMVSNDEALTKDIQSRLELLDQHMGLEQSIQREYGEKSLKARVHAELVLLEYYYRHRESLQFYDGDRYIGASKPACYCCHLYFREHPADLVQPATHQKIYLNWLPPTSGAPEVEDPNTDAAVHERDMVNAMVKSLRKRTIEHLTQQTGGPKRQRKFDSVTWETFPRTLRASTHDGGGRGRSVGGVDWEVYSSHEPVSSPLLVAGFKPRDPRTAPGGLEAELVDRIEEELEATSQAEDTDDDDGGVALGPQ